MNNSGRNSKLEHLCINPFIYQSIPPHFSVRLFIFVTVADDTNLLSREIVQSDKLFQRVETEAAKIGLHLNTKKTEMIAINSDNEIDTFTVNAE